MRYGATGIFAAMIGVATPAAAQQAEPPPTVPAVIVAVAAPVPGAMAAPEAPAAALPLVAPAAVARSLSADETLWHMRAALNVAALSCRGVGDEAIVAAYGAMLDAERVVLAAAHDGVQARYRLHRGVAASEAAYDDDMTRLYNHFAQPPQHAAFCATARAVLDEVRGIAAAEMPHFAAAALAALEAPFATVTIAAAEGDAAWRARPDATVIATAAPVPVGPPGAR